MSALAKLGGLADLPPTLDAEQTAEIFGCSKWSLYELVKRNECPVEPLHLGRKLRWPTAAVLRAVGLSVAEMPAPTDQMEAVR